MTTNVRTHHVSHIETSKRTELESGSYIRTITVTKDNGEEMCLTLFADEFNALEVRGDRL